MLGTDASTGRAIGGIDQLRQSIADILGTPIGSRVGNREYGSRLFELIDAPLNPGTIAEIYSATAEAIARWEPRFVLRKAKVSGVSGGRITLTLTGEHIGVPLTLEGITV